MKNKELINDKGAISLDKCELENRKAIIRIIISVLLLIAGVILVSKSPFVENNALLKCAIFLIPYLIVGFEVVADAIENLIKLKPMDEKVLMTIATIGAFVLGEYQEAVAVMVFYQIGEFFQDYSIDKSRNNIKELVDVTPEFANVERNGKICKVNPSEVKIDEIIVVNPFERIPIDGEIIEGATTLNTSMLTGESIPRYVTVGDAVSSGLINNEKLIKIKTLKEFKDSTASKIIDLIENAAEKKSASENFITSFAKIYTPIVCLIAVLTFIIPICLQQFVFKIGPEFSVWGYRALTVLVISCPCAILISVPLAFYSSIGVASRLGILVKGSNYIELLSRIKTFIFDKTGTMTKGVFEVVGVHHNIMSEDELFKYAAHVESFSNHPIAKSILKYYGKEIDTNIVKDVKEIGGRGLSATVNNKFVLIGNAKLMQDNKIEYKECSHVGTIVHIAIDNVYEGHILITDIIKDNAKESIQKLKKLGVKSNVMLTGDRESIAREVSNEIGMDTYNAELLPEDKFSILESYMKNSKVAFVGDGINDAACITRADVGMAMGTMGSASSVDLADIVLMDDKIENVVKTLKLSRVTMRIVYENIAVSVGIKVLVLLLSIFGISNMWLAVFSDVGVMVLAVINSIRLTYMNKNKFY